MTQEALKQMNLALETMEAAGKRIDELKAENKALKEALAQPQEEKLHPVHIGVDVAKEGTTVTAFYRKPDAVMEMFYSQFHPMAQPEQEPVAWRTFDGEGGYDYRSYEDNESYADDWDKRNPNHKGWVDKLYTHPQRTWVGLTAEDRLTAKYMQDAPDGIEAVIDYIEAKLKEKNFD